MNGINGNVFTWDDIIFVSSVFGVNDLYHYGINVNGNGDVQIFSNVEDD